MGVTTLEDLDLQALPAGELSRVQIDLIHNGLGQAMRLPVLVARGRKPGPVFGMTAAIHGDELNGIPVIHSLLHQLDLRSLRGTVVGVPVLNIPGFLRRTRQFTDNRDLNHLFPGRLDGGGGEVYVYRLLERVIRKLDWLVDLHTASVGRVNCLYVRADMTQPRAAQMAYLQRPEVIVHNPPQDGTLRGAAQYHGIPSITIEIGNPQRYHREYIRRTEAGLRAVLSYVEMIPRRAHALGELPILCSRAYWLHTDRGGLMDVHPGVTQTLEAREKIATLTDIYGDPVKEYYTPEAGVVIGHGVDPVAQTGARILHLGILAQPDDPRFQHREELPE